MCLKTADNVVHLINNKVDGPCCSADALQRGTESRRKPDAMHEKNHMRGTEG